MICGKYIKRYLLIAIVTILISSGYCLAEENEFFDRGNTYYEQEEYNNAIDEYKKIIAGGEVYGPLYFNLANAYFKKGELGKAIVNYERAEIFIPRDADLNANLKFAVELVNGKKIPQKGIWAWRTCKNL